MIEICDPSNYHYHVKMRPGEYLSLDDVLLVPKHSTINSRLDTNISTILVGDIRLQAPVITAAMDKITEQEMAIAVGKCGGCGFLHRFAPDEKIINMVRDVKETGCLAIPSVGIRDDIVKWVGLLRENDADCISIDIAHADNKRVLDSIEMLKSVYGKDCLLIAGNIATGSAAKRLVNAGVDCIKAFVGPGSHCSTRVVTGFGFPTFSSLVEIVYEARKYNIPVIADGGLKGSGDFVKALAVGACACMSGSLFAGTQETPGGVIKINDKLYKEYRGMASYKSQKDFKGGLKKGTAPEGEASLVPLGGSVEEVMDRICGGIRSGLSYAGANNLEELRENAEFIRITSSAYFEGTPHGLKK
jgi:IMP dehydrogenase